MKKYKFTEEKTNWYGRTLHQIKAIIDFGDIEAGDVGGWLESEENLSHEGDCWVDDSAIVFGNAKIVQHAAIGEYAVIGGHAVIGGNAEIGGSAQISGHAVIGEHAKIGESAQISGHVQIGSEAEIDGAAKIGGNTVIGGFTEIGGNAAITSSRDYITINPIGGCPKDGLYSITAFRTPKGVRIKYGKFYGNIEVFKRKMRLSHDNNFYIKEYLALAEFLKARFKE